MVRLHEEESDTDLSEMAHLLGAIGEDANGAALLAGRPNNLVDNLQYGGNTGSGAPRETDRSTVPMNMPSTPSIAAISPAWATASASSSWTTTTVRLSLSTLCTSIGLVP